MHTPGIDHVPIRSVRQAVKLRPALTPLALATVLASCGGDGSVAGPPPAPLAPTSLEGIPLSSSRVGLSWTDASSDEMGFRIERSLQSVGNWAAIDSVGPNITGALDEALQPGTDYAYRVAALGAGTTSGWSNTEHVVTPLPPRPSALTLPDGLVGAPYAAAIEAVGGVGSYTWSLMSGTLPEGLALDASTGRVSGTPATIGTTHFSVEVATPDEAGAGFLTLSILDSLRVTGTELPDAWANVPYLHVFGATGGFGKRVWSITAGSPPDGLKLDSLGALAGTPTGLGTFDFTLGVQSEDGQAVAVDFSLAVDVAPVSISTADLSLARVGVQFHDTLRAVGGAGSYTWTLGGAGLPAGLSLHGALGTIQGVPTQAGVTSITVTARDAEGREAHRTLSLAVCGPGLSLTTGESVSRAFPDDGCGLALAEEPAEYRVAIMSRTTVAGPTPISGGLRLEVTTSAPASTAPGRHAPWTLARSAPRPDGGLDPQTAALAAATERLHHQLREEEFLETPNASSSTPSRLGPPLSAAARAAAAAEEPAARRSFWVRDPEARTRISVAATLRGVSASIVYYEDDAVATAGTRATDQQVQDLLDYYEAHGRTVIDESFGGLGPEGTTNNFKDDFGTPVTLPANDIDNNEGRLIVLQIRPALMPDGAAAYVSACDRRPRPANHNAGTSVCTRSNQAEMTYFSRPGTSFYLGTLVHEAKHVSSHGYAIFGGRDFNWSWVEEGTAEIAKEKSSRDASGLVDGAEADYATLYPGGERNSETYGMTLVHSRARAYLRASPVSALVGNPDPNPGGSTYYGASWLFHRFLADNYAGGDEDAFFRAMNTGGPGPQQIEVVTGRPLEALLDEFLRGIGLEGEPDARAAASVRYRSYDYANIAFEFDGIWPYVQHAGEFVAGSWVLSEAHHTSPLFFDFSSGGPATVALALSDASGAALTGLDDIVMVITRLR